MDISEELKQIADYYGWDAQSNMLIEECAELIQAVNKYKRANGSGQPMAEYHSSLVFDNLIEEIADVEIMLEQIKHLLKVPEEEIHTTKVFKIIRTKEKMAKSKGE